MDVGRFVGVDALAHILHKFDQFEQHLGRVEARLASEPSATSGAFSFAPRSAEPQFSRPKMKRESRPHLPDPRLVRRIIKLRQLRSRHFHHEYFADPAWDMLLDLTAARAEHQRVSVTSLCIASGVPPTTALRWIADMVKAGIFVRVDDTLDKRRSYITLSDSAADSMGRYFEELSLID